jgi:hypothetical protein
VPLTAAPSPSHTTGCSPSARCPATTTPTPTRSRSSPASRTTRARGFWIRRPRATPGSPAPSIWNGSGTVGNSPWVCLFAEDLGDRVGSEGARRSEHAEQGSVFGVSHRANQEGGLLNGHRRLGSNDAEGPVDGRPQHPSWPRSEGDSIVECPLQRCHKTPSP